MPLVDLTLTEVEALLRGGDETYQSLEEGMEHEEQLRVAYRKLREAATPAK